MSPRVQTDRDSGLWEGDSMQSSECVAERQEFSGQGDLPSPNLCPVSKEKAGSLYWLQCAGVRKSSCKLVNPSLDGDWQVHPLWEQGSMKKDPGLLPPPGPAPQLDGGWCVLPCGGCHLRYHQDCELSAACYVRPGRDCGSATLPWGNQRKSLPRGGQSAQVGGRACAGNGGFLVLGPWHWREEGA